MSKSNNSNDSRPAATASVPVPRVTRGGPKAFLRDVRRELTKVEWPSRKETNRLTGVVFAVVGIALVAVFLMAQATEILIKIMQGKL